MCQVFFSYKKGKKWSSLSISHQLNSLTPYVFDVNAEFSLSQVFFIIKKDDIIQPDKQRI